MAKKSRHSPFASRDDEIAKLKAELEQLRAHAQAKRFAKSLMDTVGIMLANMPYDTWPDLAKKAFEHEAKRAPNAAPFYKSFLPR